MNTLVIESSSRARLDDTRVQAVLCDLCNGLRGTEILDMADYKCKGTSRDQMYTTCKILMTFPPICLDGIGSHFICHSQRLQ